MNEANTLVASYCFPPYNDASGIVASKRVRVEDVPVSYTHLTLPTNREV